MFKKYEFFIALFVAIIVFGLLAYGYNKTKDFDEKIDKEYTILDKKNKDEFIKICLSYSGLLNLDKDTCFLNGEGFYYKDLMGGYNFDLLEYNYLKTKSIIK